MEGLFSTGLTPSSLYRVIQLDGGPAEEISLLINIWRKNIKRYMGDGNRVINQPFFRMFRSCSPGSCKADTDRQTDL